MNLDFIGGKDLKLTGVKTYPGTYVNLPDDCRHEEGVGRVAKGRRTPLAKVGRKWVNYQQLTPFHTMPAHG